MLLRVSMGEGRALASSKVVVVKPGPEVEMVHYIQGFYHWFSHVFMLP